MKRALLIVLILLAALFGGGYWFWTLGASTPAEAATITLHNIKGQVEVSGSDQVWKTVTEGQTALAGQTIRTGAESQVSVDFFRQGETRLAPNSTLIIGSDTKHEDRSGGLLVNLRLERGRVWSRVRQLLDLESSYTVTTDQVVATVRGTAFDLAKHEDGTSSLLVSHSVVAGNNGLIPEGYVQMYGKKGQAMGKAVRASEKELRTPWIQKNEEDDILAMKRWKEKDQKAIAKHQNPSLAKLTMLSTGMRAMTAKQDPLEIAEKIAQQELALIHTLTLQGKSEEALKELEVARERMAELDIQSNEVQMILKRLLPRAQRLFEDVERGTPEYSVKEALEETLVSVTKDTSVKSFNAVLETNQGIDNALRAIEEGQGLKAETTISEIRATIQAALDTPIADMHPQVSAALRERWQAALLRLNTLPHPTTSTQPSSLIPDPLKQVIPVPSEQLRPANTFSSTTPPKRETFIPPQPAY